MTKQEAEANKADLYGADLRDADLSYANLSGANLSGANLPAFSLVPEESSFIAWKKLRNGVVAKLLIPAEAKRTSSLVGRKCRAEFIEVLSLSEGTSCSGQFDELTIYTVGETVKADSYNDDIRLECTHGIHFFVTKQEAIDY